MSTYTFAVKGISVVVSSEDAARVQQWTWSMAAGGYVKGHVNRRPLLLHHFILGKPEPGFVVDHVDGDKYNNTRGNLRFATYAQNSQNRIKRPNTSSRYRCVYAIANNWGCEVGGIYGGRFADEVEAAKQADRMTIKMYGATARTNDLLSTKERLEAESGPSFTKTKRLLPQGVSYDRHTIKKPYYTCTRDSRGKRVRRFFSTVAGAQAHLEGICPIEEVRPQDFIVSTCNTRILIDPDDYQLLSRCRWLINSQGYAANSSGQLMHRLIMQAEAGTIVDHINCVKHDNRKSNLRISTFSQNSQNRRKQPNCSSQFVGVYKTGGRWRAHIKHQYQTYCLGTFDDEVTAARAYNSMAQQLYDNPRLNTV